MKPITAILLLIIAMLLLTLFSCSKVDLNEYSYEDNGIREVQVKVLIIPNGIDQDKPSYGIELIFDNYVKGNVLGNVTWQCESADGGRIDYYNVNFNIPCNGLKCETVLLESVYWWSLPPEKIELISIKCENYIFKQ